MALRDARTILLGASCYELCPVNGVFSEERVKVEVVIDCSGGG